MKLNLVVNKVEKEFTISPSENLLQVLRREGYHSIKSGCNSGTCGACTIIMNDKIVNACMITAAQCEGAKVETAEGLSHGQETHPIQQAYVDAGAVQCGYCTPGMVLATKNLLAKDKNPSEEKIRDHLSGNLCRCTGYNKIIDAVKLSNKYMKEGK